MDKNPFSIKGKNILITGASSGIGQKCAIVCSNMGANVILIARQEKKLIDTINLLTPGNHLMFPFDVTNFSNIDTIIKEVASKLGLIDGFVHSAGIELLLPFSITKPEHYENLYKTNVTAGMEFAKVISKNKYHNQGKLSIVFIASVMGFLGEIAHLAYCCTKGALLVGTKALALELAEKNIRVNCISPAQIQDTNMTENMLDNFTEVKKIENLKMHPLGYGRTEDVAYGVLYLLSDASRWITGTNLIIDGGYSAK